MEIVKEKKIGDEVEVQFELSADEYDSLYEDYLREKELKEDSENYSFEDYFQELITLILLKEKERKMQDEIRELKNEIKLAREQLQAKEDGNNS